MFFINVSNKKGKNISLPETQCKRVECNSIKGGIENPFPVSLWKSVPNKRQHNDNKVGAVKKAVLFLCSASNCKFSHVITSDMDSQCPTEGT